VPAMTETGWGGHVATGPERKKSPGPAGSVSSKVPGEAGGFGGAANVIENGAVVAVATNGPPSAGTFRTPEKVGSPAL
jgi:hypothetical protein